MDFIDQQEAASNASSLLASSEFAASTKLQHIVQHIIMHYTPESAEVVSRTGYDGYEGEAQSQARVELEETLAPLRASIAKQRRKLHNTGLEFQQN